jgi:hypothetical protein
VAENRDRFWWLNFMQKLGDCLQQLFWLVEGLADERSLRMTEKPEVRWRKIRIARWGTRPIWFSVINCSVAFEKWTQRLSK